MQQPQYIKLDRKLDNGQINKEKILAYYFNKDSKITIKFAGNNIPKKFKNGEFAGEDIGKQLSGVILQKNIIDSIEDKKIETNSGEIEFKNIYILGDKIVLILDKGFFCSLELENTNNPIVVSDLLDKFHENINSMNKISSSDNIGFKTLFGKGIIPISDSMALNTIKDKGIEKYLTLMGKTPQIKNQIKKLIPFIKL